MYVPDGKKRTFDEKKKEEKQNKTASRLIFSAISTPRSNADHLREFKSRLNLPALTPS